MRKNIITVVDDFISEEEIEKIKISVFNLKSYWKNIFEYPIISNQLKTFNKNKLKKIAIDLKKNFNLHNVEVNDNHVNDIINFLTYQYGISLESFEVMSDVLNIISHSEVISDNVILRLQNRIWQKDLCQNMLGDALYLLSGNFDLIDWNTQKIIRDEFSWIHQKLIDSLEKIVKNQITLYDKLPCPAFHIFGSSEFNKLEFSYHKDISVCDYDKNIDKNSIYSYVTVIQSPSEQPFLDYVFGKQFYEKTKLYIWKGTMDHRIGTFSLSGGEYRITLQGHMFYDKQDKIVKLFF